MMHKWIALALFSAAPAALAQGAAPLDVKGAVADMTAAQPAPAPTGFNSKVTFSPTYSSGYYYASPYAGYTSLAYYGSIYTARKFGG